MKKTKVIYNHDNRPEWKIREEKIKRRIRFGPPSYVIKNDYNLQRWNANISVMERGEKGDIQTLTCASCNAIKPYYEFYADYNGNLHGRACRCIMCSKEWRKGKKTQNKKNAKRFATHLTVVIKRDLHLRNNSFQTLINREIWEALGYSPDEFINHFVNLMEPWMNWENNRTPRKIGDKCWHVDHIKPKSHFKYISIHDDGFKQCWSLTNLKPIEAKINMVKNDFYTINDSIRDLYRRYVIQNKKDYDSRWKKYFDFSIEEARQDIFSKLKDEMTFDNHGELWHLDHIVPLTAMPFNSFKDDNFKKVWHYKNLQPILIKDNLGKGSKHEKAKYYTQNYPFPV